MGDAINEVLLKGGPVAMVLAVALALRYLASAYVTWRRGRREENEPSPVADAATTNALLLDALRAERSENAAKSVELAQVQQECQRLRIELFEQRRQFEEEIRDLQNKIMEAQHKLEDLHRRIAIPNSDQV